MKKLLWMPFLALFLSTGAITLSGCQDGTFEEAGEELDDEIDDATDG